MQAVLWVLVGVVLASAYFLLKTRRLNPRLDIAMDDLPAVSEGMSTLAGLTGGAVYSGNDVRILQNSAIFDAMEQDILAARCTVHLETFVWTEGAVERRFIDLLSRKAREGVSVRLLIDALGGNERDDGHLEQMKKSGVELQVYSQVRPWNLRRFNHRTHRKILVCDGAVAYTFGHGFSDLWLGNAEDPKHVRDTGVRIEGPAVTGLQSVFMENWIEESHCVPTGDGCFPRLEHKGDVEMHVVRSASGDAVSSVALLYTIAIASARREVLIQNPYFAPPDGFCDLLKRVVDRGVDIHLMVPGGNTDNALVRRAGCALYDRLLEAGVKLYEYQPTLLHQKVVVVDGLWSHVGSTNFDARSLALNEEIGVGFCDSELASQLRTAFLQDLKQCREITRDVWRRRSLVARLGDRVCYQLHDQL